jgi:hypothetical protein
MTPNIRYLLPLLFALISPGIFAQSPLCLAKGKSPGSIDYDAAKVDTLLHFDQYKVVLFGEMHNGSFNPEIEYHFLKHLNQAHGFRHVFLETSVSAAWHLNQYVRTGDTSVLNKMLSTAGYDQWLLFCKRMYEHNRTLPDSLKIVFHGVDFERTGVFSTILELAPAGVPPPKSLQPALDTAKAHLQDKPLAMYDFINGKFVEYDNTAFVSALRFLQKALLDNPKDAGIYFGSNYPVVQDIAANDGEVTVMPKPRNRTMFRTMSRIIREQKIDKFFGVFGSQHTIYTQPSAISNAVRKLDGIRAKDVLSIQEIVYNVRSKSDTFHKIPAAIISLNGNCKGTLLPAAAVPGYKKRADFVLIGNAAP